jgi:hypothetical protein
MTRIINHKSIFVLLFLIVIIQFIILSVFFRPIIALSNDVAMSNISQESADYRMSTISVETRALSESMDSLSDDLIQKLESAIILRNAVLENNISYCDDIISNDVQMHNHCIQAFAIKNDDVSTCDKVIGGTTTIIGKSFEEEKDSCILELARASNEGSLCNLMSNDKNRVSCINVLVAMMMCQNSTYKDECYNNKALEYEQEAVCSNINSKSTLSTSMGDGKWTKISMRDNCIEAVAEKKVDLESCNEIKQTYVKDSCYREIAYRTNNSKICDSIITPEWKDVCYSLTKECDKIVDQEDIDWCYKYIALDTKDDSYCERIVGSLRKDDCYYVVAVGRQDTSFCDIIKDPDMKSSCYTYAVKS